MTKITADASMHAAVTNLRGLAELRDAHGALLGYFLAPMSQEELQLYLKVLAEYDPEETERRVREESGKGRALQEVLESLERGSCATP